MDVDLHPWIDRPQDAAVSLSGWQTGNLGWPADSVSCGDASYQSRRGAPDSAGNAPPRWHRNWPRNRPEPCVAAFSARLSGGVPLALATLCVHHLCLRLLLSSDCNACSSCCCAPAARVALPESLIPQILLDNRLLYGNEGIYEARKGNAMWSVCLV